MLVYSTDLHSLNVKYVFFKIICIIYDNYFLAPNIWFRLEFSMDFLCSCALNKN